MRYDDAAWLIACGALSALGVVAAVLTYRNRGWGAGIRVLGWALLPISVWLTGLGRLLGTVVFEAARWIGGLAFSPRVWVGVVLFAVAFLMLGGAGFVRRRRRKKSGAETEQSEPKRQAQAKPTKPTKPTEKAVQKKGETDSIEGLEDIEEILKRRGIE